MSNENNGWETYSKLVLQQLETMASGIESLRTELQDVKGQLTELKAREDRVSDLKSWKEKLISLVNVTKKSYVLDLASGSGDLTKLLKDKVDCNCLIFDSNLEMLKNAKKKIKNAQIISGKAENLPFKDESFDYVIVGFGLRNFSDIDQSLRETWRVLKKNGNFLCLEFSEINNFFIRKLFYLYGKIIPKYAGVFLNRKIAYDYLIESIKQFPNQVELSGKLKRNKYSNIEVIDIIDGLASIHIAQKK